MESTTCRHHTTLAAYMGPHGSDRLTAAQPANRRRQFPPPSSTPLLRVESLTTLVSSLSKDTFFHFFLLSFLLTCSAPSLVLRCSCLDSGGPSSLRPVGGGLLLAAEVGRPCPCRIRQAAPWLQLPPVCSRHQAAASRKRRSSCLLPPCSAHQEAPPPSPAGR